jgi:tetratricopeptide (TPR) repeat protein
MILFHRGENIEALSDIRKLISYAEEEQYQEFLSSNLYLNEGCLHSENLSYDAAIISLTKAIEKDPSNLEAYFERAIAYFELGDFEKSLDDYLASGYRPNAVDKWDPDEFDPIRFGQGIALGILKGGRDSATEFIPSLLASFRGISRGIWAFVTDPINISKDMIGSVFSCLNHIVVNTPKELICKLAPELQECIKKWRSMDSYQAGNMAGYIVGKYGIDIFIGTGSVKALQLYRNLKRANAVMTLETAASSKHSEELLAQAWKEWKSREEVFKNGNLRIQWDKQGKHILGHRNYNPNKRKSILTHENPQELIDGFAGTGIKKGTPYQENLAIKNL